jgi:hypothetical protein
MLPVDFFKLIRRRIVERRMEPMGIVDLFDEGANVLAGMGDVAIRSRRAFSGSVRAVARRAKRMYHLPAE